AACYAHMGRLIEAQKVMERLRAMNPDIMSGSIPYRKSEHRDLYISGLRLAAGEAVWVREKLATVLECEPAGLSGGYSPTTTGGDAYSSERWPPSLSHHTGAVRTVADFRSAVSNLSVKRSYTGRRISVSPDGRSRSQLRVRTAPARRLRFRKPT